MIQKLEKTEKRLTSRNVKEHLTEGKVYTYAEICNLLCQPKYSGTNQKEAQLKQFARYFDYQRDGKKYTIKKIYNKPKPKEPNKLRSNNKYVQYIEYLLMNELYNNRNSNNIIMSQKELWQFLSMANTKYFYYGRSKDAKKRLLAEKLSDEMTLAHICSFFDVTGDKFYDILKSSLNSMKRRMFITTDDVFVIGNNSNDMHIASDYEIEKWMKGKRKVLTKYGFENVWEAKRYLGYTEFDRFLNEMNNAAETESGYRYLMQKIKIIYHTYSMKEFLDNNEARIQEAKEELNKAILNTVTEKMLKKINDLKAKTGFGSMSKEMEEKILMNKMHLLLSEYLIKNCQDVA